MERRFLPAGLPKIMHGRRPGAAGSESPKAISRSFISAMLSTAVLGISGINRLSRSAVDALSNPWWTLTKRAKSGVKPGNYL